MWDRISGIIGNSGIKTLHNSTVAIVGLGSLGSEIAIQLGMSGVGSFILIDPDTLSTHNVVRHAADLRYVGKLKVDAVAELLRYRNPKVHVEKVRRDVFEDENVLRKADLVIVAGLGSEIAQQRLGHSLRTLGIPALFSAVYARAVAGEALFIHQTDGPCYSCLASMIANNFTETLSDVPLVYGMMPDQIEAEPGLGIHIKRVASMAAHWAMTLLCPSAFEPMPGNLVILSNERYCVGQTDDGQDYILEPSSSLWQNVDQNANCRVCNVVQIASGASLKELLED